jgi:lipoate---protein ligase
MNESFQPHLVDFTPSNIATELARDELLLIMAEEGLIPPTLRFWEVNQPAVVLGAGGLYHTEVNTAGCRSDGVPILRRTSGGGTVLLGKGCLLFTLVLPVQFAPELKEVTPSYRYILGQIAEALSTFAPVRLEGICDLTIYGRKFSGNAQQRKYHHILHHGTIMYGFDLEAISHYLLPPPRMPDYREERLHQDFVCNFPADRLQLQQLISELFSPVPHSISLPKERIEELLTAKYRNPEWNERR